MFALGPPEFATSESESMIPIKRSVHDCLTGPAKRADFLFDFCSGFPARFRDCPDKATASDRIHQGYGNCRWNELRKMDVENWLVAHPRWKSTRAAVQTVSRAFNYCCERSFP
jgi:hypothetical protein